ncbi:MAG: DUF438 domain-containing protein [Erysipelotrichaceae bacterium]
MSDMIDNQSQRQLKLKNLIQRLHAGEDREGIEAEFKADFAYVTGAEIAQMENNLVNEGVSIEEIQSLCDIHASLFSGSVKDLHSDELTLNPLKEFEDENAIYQKLLDQMEECRDEKPTDLAKVKKHLGEMLTKIKAVEMHYSKKENILFPYLEKAGVTTVPQVMWGVDNNIRNALHASEKLIQNSSDIMQIKDHFFATLDMIKEMITKENNILFPMLKEQVKTDQWKEIAGLLNDKTQVVYQKPLTKTESNPSSIPLNAGSLSINEINAIFNTVPFDMTFVDADNKVKYVSQGKERVFDRPSSVVGRPIHLCHPPQSVATVLKIVEDLRSGKKDHEDFWINFRGKFVHIRYFALRDTDGSFLGTLEVSQDLSPLKALEGEKRLASE